MAIENVSVTQSGDRSCSVSFDSGANTDVLTFAEIAAELTEGTAIFDFIDGAPVLADFATEGAAVSLVSSNELANGVGIEATGFKGFPAGNYVLRVSLSYSASE